MLSSSCMYANDFVSHVVIIAIAAASHHSELLGADSEADCEGGCKYEGNIHLPFVYFLLLSYTPV